VKAAACLTDAQQKFAILSRKDGGVGEEQNASGFERRISLSRIGPAVNKFRHDLTSW
jgi:hypothetical protein